MAQSLNLEMTTAGVQNVVNFLWYIILGVLALVIFGILFYKLYEMLTYKYRVWIYRKVGDTQIREEVPAREVKLDGNYMIHYKGINKFSPVIDPSYFGIVQKSYFMGLWKRAFLGYSGFLDGVTIFPMKVQNNPGLVPINIDQFNYLQSRIKANAQKYARTNKLLQMLPYVGLSLVVIMFIVGMIFYTKHVENITGQIIAAAQQSATQIMEKSGAVQILN